MSENASSRLYKAKRNHVGSRVRTPANRRYWQLVTCEDTANVTVFSLGGCTLAAWEAGTTYHKKDLVQYNTIKWKSKRTSQGIEPGTSPSKWTNLGTCNE